MNTAMITLEVDSASAKAFENASPENRKKLELLLSLRLRDLTKPTARPLTEIMDEIGRRAEAEGLSQEKLDALMRDE